MRGDHGGCHDHATPTFLAPVTATPGSNASGHGLGRGLMTLLAVSVFATASAMHFQTPMLGRIGAEFNATPAAVGWIPTLSFAGFLAGTLFLVPLGDRYDKRTLILVKLFALIGSVLLIAAAPSMPVLWAASFIVGVGTSLSQHVIPLVAELAAPPARGGAVGTVLSGLFLGILFARVVGGIVAETLGWRWMYVISACMLATIAVALVARLPQAPPRTTHSYAKARSRLNTVFAAHIWGGNAVGAFLASTALTHFGWWAVCGISFVAASIAMLLHRR